MIIACLQLSLFASKLMETGCTFSRTEDGMCAERVGVEKFRYTTSLPLHCVEIPQSSLDCVPTGGTIHSFLGCPHRVHLGKDLWQFD